MKDVPVCIPVEHLAWRAIGDTIGADENENVLLASIMIGSAKMQIIAIEVTTESEQQDVVDKSCRGLLDIIYQVSGEGDALESVSIGARTYLLIITPRLK